MNPTVVQPFDSWPHSDSCREALRYDVRITAHIAGFVVGQFF
jgi:hypothetical protein